MDKYNSKANSIKIYNGGDFGSEPFATTDVESVWKQYAEAAEYGQYEDAEQVEAQAHADFLASFVDFDPTNEHHVSIATKSGLFGTL